MLSFLINALPSRFINPVVAFGHGTITVVLKCVKKVGENSVLHVKIEY